MNTKPFSFDTIHSFDDHIDQSIPGYSVLQRSILRLATHFIRDNSRVYDLGCSTGLLLSRLALLTPDSTQLIGIDQSLNLLGLTQCPKVLYRQQDLTDPAFTLDPACLVLSIFTLQFLPLDVRQQLIDKIYEALPVGGAFIFSEKQYINDGYLQELFTFSHYDLKYDHFTAEEVLTKQQSLRKIMRPVSEGENRELLKSFSRVVSFWQFLHFKAYLCLK